MSHLCDKCGRERAGWPYLAAHLATVGVVAATAVWVYGIGEAWGTFLDAQAIEPWWGVQAILALVSAFAGLLVGTVVFFIGEGIADHCREMRPSWSGVRRRLRVKGQNCRWCGCARRSERADVATCADASGKKEEAGST